MGSTSVTPLAEQLKEAGISLLSSPSSVEELLALLDKAEDLLFNVDQAPPESIKDALLPMMEALKSEALLEHSDVVVRVSVASCIHEIARISAPLEPYDDELMKEIFKLTVSSFKKLSQPSTRCYEKAASMLHTIAKVQSCVMMLDLECDDLVIEMFRHFLKAAGSNHKEDVLWAMERIMTLVLEESEDISTELLEPLLSSVRNENENAAPISWKLGESVISNCSDKLRPVLKEAVQSSGIALDEYAPVIASICGSSSDNSDYRLPNGSQEQGGSESLAATSAKMGAKSGSNGHFTPVPVTGSKSFPEDSSGKLKPCNLVDADGQTDLKPQSKMPRKRDRKPNSLMNPEEGYEHFLGLRNRKCSNTKPYESPYPEDSRERKRGRFSKKEQKALGLADVSPKTASDEEREPLDRKEPNSSAEMGSNGKKQGSVSDKKKPEVSRKKKAGLSASTPSIKDGVNSKKTSRSGLKRKRSPGTDSDQQDVGEEIVGRKIKVWWPQDKVFYDGVVRCYDSKKKRHHVLYTDDVEERLNLKMQRWKLVEDKALPDVDTANPKHNEQPELLHITKKRKRSRSTIDPNPYQPVKRAGASSAKVKIEPSDGYNEDGPASMDINVGTIPQIDGTEFEDVKTCQTE